MTKSVPDSTLNPLVPFHQHHSPEISIPVLISHVKNRLSGTVCTKSRSYKEIQCVYLKEV